LIVSLPAKNRRRIKLDCGGFRYIFTPNKNLNRGRLVVERDDYYGSLLIVQWCGLLPDKPSVLPRRHLRTAIEFAMQSGWSKTSESQFEIGCDATKETLLLIKRPDNVPNDWFQDFQFENPGEKDDKPS